MMQFILAERLRTWFFPDAGGPLLLACCFGLGALQWQAVLPDWRWLTAGIAGMIVAAGLLHLGEKSAAPKASMAGGVSLLRLLFGLALAMALGFAWAAWRAELRLADQLPLAWERRDVSVVGIVAELPRELERGRRFVFEVESVDTPGAVVPRRILLSWYSGSHEDQWLDDRILLPGERWRFTVRLKRPHGNVNPGGFDYEGWLLERGLRATGYVRARPGAERLGEVWTVATSIERLRARLRLHLQKNLGNATAGAAGPAGPAGGSVPASPYGGVVIALALGDQGSINSEQWRVFAATGTTHLMSISGLHITMMAALFGGLVNWFWRRQPRGMLFVPAQRMAVLSGWLAALAYTLLAGAGIPAVRTLLMLSVGALAHTLDRQVAAPRILLLALFTVLVFDPWAVLVVGFWLSFAAVGVLLFFAGHDAAVDRPARDNATVTPERSRFYRGLALLRDWTWAQWVVTLASVPLVLSLFQALSLASPLANAVAIPLVGLVIAPLAVAAALLPLPALASVAHMLLAGLMVPLEWLAAQPWALWQQAVPPSWAVVLAVAGIVLHFALRRWPWRLASLVLLLPIFFLPPPRPASGEAWIELLDVGQGLSALVRTHRHNLLFDAGPRYSAELSAGERLVLPALRALGVTRLDGLVISHQDHDHAGGMAAVLDELAVGWLNSSLPADSPQLAGRVTSRRSCVRGEAFEWDGVSFRFLSPPPAYYEVAGINSNRLSCVLRIEAAGRVALLTGDAEANEELAMLTAAELGDIDVLQVAHHGSRSSSSARFVAASSPQWALFPVGYRNPFGHPHAEVVESYRSQGARLMRTDLDGAIHVELAERLVVSAARQQAPRYWFGQ